MLWAEQSIFYYADCTHTHTHTHTVLIVFFPGEAGLAGFAPWFCISIYSKTVSSWNGAKLLFLCWHNSTKSFSDNLPILFHQPLSSDSIWPHQHHPVQDVQTVFLLARLTGSNPSSYLISALVFFQSFNANSHTQRPSKCTRFSSTKLYLIFRLPWPGLTAMYRTSPHTAGRLFTFWNGWRRWWWQGQWPPLLLFLLLSVLTT